MKTTAESGPACEAFSDLCSHTVSQQGLNSCCLLFFTSWWRCLGNGRKVPWWRLEVPPPSVVCRGSDCVCDVTVWVISGPLQCLLAFVAFHLFGLFLPFFFSSSSQTRLISNETTCCFFLLFLFLCFSQIGAPISKDLPLSRSQELL